MAVILLQIRTTAMQGAPATESRLDPHHAERLDHITWLDVVEVLQKDTALVTLVDLAYVVFAAPQRLDQPGEGDLAAT